MALFKWLKSKLTSRSHADWLYRRGMARAIAGQTESAIDDYRTVTETPEAEPRIRAMARYNLALLLYAVGEVKQAQDELNRVLEDVGAPERVKTEARRKILRVLRASERSE